MRDDSTKKERKDSKTQDFDKKNPDSEEKKSTLVNNDSVEKEKEESKTKDCGTKNPDYVAKNMTPHVMAAGPVQTDSTNIRIKGNEEFKNSKMDGLNRNGRISFVLKAITLYEKALKSAKDDEDSSKACKNLAVSYNRILDLEDREDNRPKYYTQYVL